MKTQEDKSVLVKARVPVGRFRNAEYILDKLGLKPSDAINIFLAQVERCQGLPFDMTLGGPALLTPEQQAEEWTGALGEY